MSTKVHLSQLTCIKNSSDPGSDDEIYLLVNIDNDSNDTLRIPSSDNHDMNKTKNNPWDLSNIELSFNENLVITLMENDNIGDDNLGSFTFTPQTTSGSQTQTDNDKDSEYSLSYTIQ